MQDATQNSDLINRESFEKKLDACVGDTTLGQLLISLLRNEPAVDAMPIVHGRWRPIWTEASTLTECSNCGGKSSILFVDQFQYCPVCGAKMDQI